MDTAKIINKKNTILMKVVNLAQISGAIANITDKLLNHILSEENTAAAQIPIFCWKQKPLTFCGQCVNGFKLCQNCCRLFPSYQCYNFRRAC
ncbi:hypothetical protein VB735_12600 [Halotia wernerae UHCC 0503]|nr:hypothetical protein [Halotia wernerae UHCC 0503]